MRYVALVFVLATACGDDEEETPPPITQPQNVQTIYEVFLPTLDKIIAKGLEAKDASTSGANITPITDSGAASGTMTVGGTVAQGSGSNENLNLWVQLDGYADGDRLTFQSDNTSDTTKPQMSINILAQPADNELDGTLNGPLGVSGEINGTATFALTWGSDLADEDAAMTLICSHVIGTVSADGQTQNIDFLYPTDTSGLDEAQLTKCQGL
jgi:hypothetical protein